MLKQTLRDEVTVHVRTSHVAGAAADTLFLIDHYDAVRTDIGGAGGTGFRTRGVGAVIAKHGQESSLGCGVSSHFARHHAGEMHALGSSVFLLAGHGAGVAANAAVEVDHHSVSCHVRTSDLRTSHVRSAQPPCRWRRIAMVTTSSPP